MNRVCFLLFSLLGLNSFAADKIDNKNLFANSYVYVCVNKIPENNWSQSFAFLVNPSDTIHIDFYDFSVQAEKIYKKYEATPVNILGSLFAYTTIFGVNDMSILGFENFRMDYNYHYNEFIKEKYYLRDNSKYIISYFTITGVFLEIIGTIDMSKHSDSYYCGPEYVEKLVFPVSIIYYSNEEDIFIVEE